MVLILSVRASTVLAIDDSPTILRVVQLVLAKAGYDVRVASDGEQGLALAREEQPDLVLLDFVMPRMNGYQVCRGLAESDATRGIPVVLMSAKGDEIGERFVKVMGIVDYVTKPFSPDTLVDVVQRALARAKPESADSADSADSPDSPDSPDSIDTADHGLASDFPFGGDTDSAGIPRLVDDGDAILRGDLARFPLADVLQLVADQHQTGVLTCSRGERRVEVFLRDGLVQFAGAEGLGEELQLGRFLVEREAISRSDLELFFRSRDAHGTRLFGEQLVQLGYLAEEDLRYALARQTAERIYEALRWREGRFSLRETTDLGARADQAALQLRVDQILVEGLRRIDEWHVLRREVDDLDAIFLRDESAAAKLAPDLLDRDEQAVLELVNAKNSVRDIVRQSRLGTFEVSRALFRLRAVRLVRRRVPPIAV